ncbi:hypothetical protein NUH30_18950 [Leptospira sp. 85282-16]|uniref:hypothetical protein n=1 Tax=Leptospira sp. 85282-16 TaxID=2971256 RepID=UPI0021C20CF6|nr:hypothetical protein [Leptospira sp. 85282-16]MCT8335772.1 hypothetical protein [Leptospira sp. 85282-16]
MQQISEQEFNEANKYKFNRSKNSKGEIPFIEVIPINPDMDAFIYLCNCWTGENHDTLITNIKGLFKLSNLDVSYENFQKIEKEITLIEDYHNFENNISDFLINLNSNSVLYIHRFETNNEKYWKTTNSYYLKEKDLFSPFDSNFGAFEIFGINQEFFLYILDDYPYIYLSIKNQNSERLLYTASERLLKIEKK